MPRKLKTAIFDIDGKATLGSYPVSDSGDRIKVVKGGEGHFMPKFNNTSFIELPRKLGPIPLGSERIYFVRKGAKQCVNFATETVHGPDPELVKIAAGSTMLKDIGKDTKPFPMWILYFLLLITAFTAAKVFGVIV